MHKTALIAGSSGLIGGLLTTTLINENYYDEIILLVRKKNVLFQHPKLIQQEIDFNAISDLKIKVNDVYCCLGTTIRKAGSKEEFYKVDCTYPIELAKMSLQNGAEQFHIISAMGANKNSSIFYNKVKGEVEEKVKDTGFKSLFIYRPSLLVGDRKEFRMGEKIGIGLAKIFSFLIPKKYKAIDIHKIVNAMILNAKSERLGIHILESDQLQTFN